MSIVQNTPASLRDRQVALEEESLTLGIDRYHKERSRQEEADLAPGRRLLKEAIGPVATAIEAFVAEARNGKPGKKHTAVRWVEKFPATELAYLTGRHCLNAITNSDTRIQTVAEGTATERHADSTWAAPQGGSPAIWKCTTGSAVGESPPTPITARFA